ncbi:flagellar protein [Heliobacterium chlorum]|uniref:Flagellar protein n=1 Tax=Heliobacterium chlorum TaxID=2698 RepID=A0ABR7T2A8_HELCL|nr:TIGR03826 family flagellar region protein [Heliobacterium chlorum]MBC9784470.1 flagellar protein [Heliobacterium chlorum]
MNVKNCPRCNRIFIPQGGRRICPVCVREEEEKYEKVREYLREYPGATLLEVVNATGVDEDTILQYIKEGRIEASDFQDAAIECERCRTPISSGRLCAKCQGDLARELQQAAGSFRSQTPERDTKSRPRDKMFTADITDKFDK